MNGSAPNIAAALAAVRPPEPPPPAPEEDPPEPPKQVVLNDEQRAMQRLAHVYGGTDLAKLHTSGVITMRPMGPRVLMRAILPEDAFALGHGIAYDARKAIAYVVEAVGSGVERHLNARGVDDDARDGFSLRRWLRRVWQGRGVSIGARPRVGDHLYVMSSGADRASTTDRSCRLWFAHADDLSAGWEVPPPPEELEVPSPPSPPAADPR